MHHRTALFLLASLVSVSGTVFAASFTDTSLSPYQTAIDGLVTRGVVQGYGDGTYRPNALINRAEFLKILVESRFPGYTPRDQYCFNDMLSIEWYSRPVCAGKELGIVQGYPDNTFRPDRAVNLVEALKMAFLSFGITPPADAGQWYQRYLTAASVRGILPHLLTEPDRLITRGEMASIAYSLLTGSSGGSSSSGTRVCGNGIVEFPEQCDDGNVKDSDGCSSICVLVSEPTRRSIVQIDQQATATVTGSSSGRQDVTLMRFNAVAGRQAALLTRLAFTAATGSLLYGQNYTLLIDSNNDSQYELIQASSKVQGGVLSFDNFTVGGVFLPLNTTMPMQVQVDIPGSAGAVKLGIRFATTLADYVQAIGYEDGLELEGIETNNVCTSSSCFIRVNTQGGTTVDVQEAGSLFVSQDTEPIRSSMIVTGSVSKALMKLRLRAVREDIDVSFLSFEDVESSIDTIKIHLINPGDSVTNLPAPIASASRGQCSSVQSNRVCVTLATNTIVIPEEQEKILVLTATTLTDQLGGVSGQDVALKMNSTNGTLHAVDARGTSSSRTLAQNDNDSTDDGEVFIGRTTVGANATITGPTHDTAFASIGSVTNAGAASSTAIPSGVQSIGSFRIIAAANSNTMGGTNRVQITKFIFSVTVQNIEIEAGSFRIRNAADPATQATCSSSGTSGNVTVTCASLSAIARDIDSGGAPIFDLVANVTNTQITSGTSTLRVSLPVLGQRGITNSIAWSDEDTSFTWVDTIETSVDSTLYQK
ncbi:MAG: S-layer homology domain-containing protein [Candidatus Peribacteraceae bacterium]